MKDLTNPVDHIENKLTIDPQTTLIKEARYIISPNYDFRPNINDIELVVIHGISLPPGDLSVKSVKYINGLFTNKLDRRADPFFKEIDQLKLSCHCLITRTGKLIQYVPFKYRAWHAGISCFNGRSNCNDFSIGIELQGSDHIPYTEEQYAVLRLLLKALRVIYPQINYKNIVGHSCIAPDRKTDPGPAFEWGKVKY